MVNNPGKEKEILVEIANSYLYKDILQIEGIRKPAHIENLLRALAFQVATKLVTMNCRESLEILMQQLLKNISIY